MTVFDQVVDQSVVVEVTGLVTGVRDPSHIDQQTLSFLSLGNQPNSHGYLRRSQTLYKFLRILKDNNKNP